MRCFASSCPTTRFSKIQPRSRTFSKMREGIVLFRSLNNIFSIDARSWSQALLGTTSLEAPLRWSRREEAELPGGHAQADLGHESLSSGRRCSLFGNGQG